MHAHSETHYHPQALHVRRVHAVPDFALEARDALLPRPQPGLPDELKHFLVVIRVGVLGLDQLLIRDGLMGFRHGY